MMDFFSDQCWLARYWSTGTLDVQILEVDVTGARLEERVSWRSDQGPMWA